MRHLLLALPAVLFVPAGASAADAPKPSPAAVEFFEAKVRPLLAEHCHACHGAKKQNAGLRLDTAAGMKQGADSGPVIVPGDPVKSLLMKVVRREGDAPMPPAKPLPADAVAVLGEWVRAGAAFPDDIAVKPAGPDPRSHWAFQPVRDPKPPVVKDATRAGNDVDRFLLAKLEEKGLTFAPPADRRTLLRRASLDLTGLPPTAEQVAAFEADRSSEAFAKVVDRLLASPQYGERWARHWLDVARYADTKGYVFREDRNYPYAYTYRDYVIKSFNADKPFDRFILEQIAADKLDLGADKTPLAAMGFLTVGRRFLGNVHDIIDDRIDTLTRGLLGLTVTCARCHDHKYDPIPQKDYYSLYGVFRSCAEPKELPVIGAAAKTPEAEVFQKELAQKKAAFDQLVADRRTKEIARLRSPEVAAAYLVAVFEVRAKPGIDVPGLLRTRELQQIVFNRWRSYVNEKSKAKLSPFAALAAAKPADLKAAATAFVASPAAAAALGPDGPTAITAEEFEKVRNRADRDAITDAAAKLDKFVAASPHAPPRAMVLADGDPFPSYVFLRGNQDNHGPTVPRQFLEVLAGPARKPFADGSGRLELAKAIATPANPLTARVWANRVWTWHFGRGLVPTPSDFGVRTEAPSHPELLDWLASRLVQSGWSTKALHRTILLSAAYRQSSADSPQAVKVDPENRLLARQNRQRLEFEALRDSMLFVAGRMDSTMGGKAVDLFKPPLTARRSVYAFVDRQNLPGTFRVFDAASPDAHTPQRHQTTVPQQALFLMNGPFALAQAKAVANRPEVAAAESPEKRVERLYSAVFARPPRTEEKAAALAFVEAGAANAAFGPWEQLAQVLLLSNEFAFAD